MSKTQQMLIAEAAKRGGRWAIECGSGRGAKGGRISYGNRERDAMFALEAAGLITITSRIKDMHWSGNGNTIHSTMFAFALNPSDEQLLAALGPCGK
jgi:hypothetical protein